MTDARDILNQVAGPAQRDPLPGEPITELGMARRLIQLHGDQLRYVPAWRRWLVWDGRRWAHDSTGQAARWAKQTARLVLSDALLIVDDKTRRAVVAEARRHETARGVAGVLTLAGTETEIVVPVDRLDPDPWLLNCHNATLDLRTGQLRPHNPNDLITKLAGAAYDPQSTGPTFNAFLDRIQKDPAMRAFLARLLGHSLLGKVIEHILGILHGEGANGKGTLTRAVMHALGDYAAAADPDLFLERGGYAAHPTGLADLHGRRLVFLHETDHGRALAEGTVKRLTGGDRVKARRMREDFWEFDPSHTAVMLTNHRPKVRGTDHAMWRRLRLVPFDVIIPDDEQDQSLDDKLTAEADAVLAWLVKGYHDWRERGLAEPKRVVEATADYRAESDTLGRFVAERCVTFSASYGRASELYAAWCKWCATDGAEPGSQTAFGTELTIRGFVKEHRKIGWVYLGLGLAADDG